MGIACNRLERICEKRQNFHIKHKKMVFHSFNFIQISKIFCRSFIACEMSPREWDPKKRKNRKIFAIEIRIDIIISHNKHETIIDLWRECFSFFFSIDYFAKLLFVGHPFRLEKCNSHFSILFCLLFFCLFIFKFYLSIHLSIRTKYQIICYFGIFFFSKIYFLFSFWLHFPFESNLIFSGIASK